MGKQRKVFVREEVSKDVTRGFCVETSQEDEEGRIKLKATLGD